MDFNPLNHLEGCHFPIPTPHENPANPPSPLLLPPATHDGTPPVTVDQTYDEDLEYFKSLPPGFRFCPYDEELILCYLLKKIKNEPLPKNMIKEVQLYDQNPAALTEKYRHFGEKEWYFFTSRTKKYKNGDRPKRATNDGVGYWKATGADKEIEYQGKTVGLRKALVYYEGKPPKGIKTNWIMHEFRENDRNKQRDCYNNSMLLDPWVLCRVYKKNEKLKSPREDDMEVEAEADGSQANNDDDTRSDSMAANFASDIIINPDEHFANDLILHPDENFVNDIILHPEEEHNGDDYVSYELPPLPESIFLSHQPTNFYPHQQFSQPVYAPPIRLSGNMPPHEFINGQMMVHGQFRNMVPVSNPSPSPPPHPGSINGPRPGDGFR